MLTDHQMEIAESIISGNKYRTTLAGLAGTGKTTVAQYIYQKWIDAGLDVCMMGPTGKSTVVLRKKGVPAVTIHSAIYHFKGQYENMRGEVELVFRDNMKGKFADRFMVDEGSMPSLQQVTDIESRDTPVLWIGDPGQLPPVKSKPNGLFNKPTHVLTEIHRQAADNPIIKWAYELRSGTPLAKPFPGIRHIEVRGRGPVFVAGKMLDLKIDRLIVKTNVQRVALNTAYRGLRDLKGVIAVGDEVVCIANNKYLDLINGEIFTVLKVLSQDRDSTHVIMKNIDTLETRSVHVWNSQFGQERKTDDEVDQSFGLFDFAYAMTCHKFQGSSCRHAGITARGFSENDTAFNYTAATRCESEATVFA